MKTSISYFREAKDRLKASDYRMAQILKITRTATSKYQSGQRIMDDTTAAKIARILEIPEIEVIAAANAEREKGEKQEFWKNFYERLGGVAASIIFAVTFLVTPTPSEAAPVLKQDVTSLYIM